MIKFKLHTVQSIFKFVFFFLIFQIGYRAFGQNINLPIYTLKSADLKNLIIKGGRSKLTACMFIEDVNFNPTKKSTLKLFNFFKNNLGAGTRVFKDEVDAKLSNRYFDTTFVPFLISNSEIKLKFLKKLPSSKEIFEDVFYFIPHLKVTDSTKVNEYDLIFTIEYLELKNGIFANKDTPAFLAALTKVASLNPCPPARPADYK